MLNISLLKRDNFIKTLSRSLFFLEDKSEKLWS